MKEVYYNGMRGCLWLYSVLVISGWALHQWTGDRLWWLALLSSFTPHFFWPLLLFWPLMLWRGRRRDRLVLLLPTLLLLYLYGGLFLPQQLPATQTEVPPLRLMTFNVLKDNRHRANTAKVIFDNGLPDIVALQEVSYAMQRTLLKIVGPHYRYYHFDSDGRGGLGLLSRYPLERLSSDLLIDLFCQQYRVTVNASHHFRLYCQWREKIPHFWRNRIPQYK